MLKNIIPNINSPKNRQRTKSFISNDLIENQSYTIIALVGYVILGLSFFEYIHLLIPPQFFNPSWEMETIGKFIETVWILLLGFMLVFFRTQHQQIKKGELKILSFLSWVTLLVAIVCFLVAPLLMSNALRINQTAEAQMNAQLTNQNNQIEKLFLQIEQASEQEINTLLSNNQIQNSFSSTTTEAKKQLIEIIQEKKQTNSEQLKQSLKNKQLQLFKSTFKWVIGAIIAGISFVSIWRYTDWARNIKI